MSLNPKDELETELKAAAVALVLEHLSRSDCRQYLAEEFFCLLELCGCLGSIRRGEDDGGNRGVDGLDASAGARH